MLVFGAKRLPEVGRSLGSMREFKGSLTSIPAELEDAISTTSDETPAPEGGAVAELSARSAGDESGG